MNPGAEECPECAGHGVAATVFGLGQRVLGSCYRCGGRGYIYPDPVPARYRITPERVETCRSKRSYRSRGRAARAIADLRAHGVPIVAPYKCHVCGSYHLTSKPRRRPRHEEPEIREEEHGDLELSVVDEQG